MADLDLRLFQWLHDSLSSGAWLFVMALLTVLGSGWGAIVVVPLLALRHTRRFGAWLVGVFSSTALLVFVLKAIVQRPRPYLVVPKVAPLVFEAPTDYSFPSGHAAGSFAFATFVAAVSVQTSSHPWKGYAVGFAALLLAAGVALSRVALGVHFPGDVTAGALLGASIGALAARAYGRRRHG